MKLMLLGLTVILTLAQAAKAMKCWRRLGICRTTCEEGEVFHILCNAEAKCCVSPKHVPVNTKSSNSAGSPG
ncbi:beta-defensin 121 [Myotis myotis]|uniref:Beta-defensin n=1 Tax=Myotis myotis TaxID=51298 RepID=A0A7J7VXP3_MYOMY|nr:beta-defensin 121 [Myotis myotis]KAF6329816.1 defensin beta 121 [Myotis myotis]